MEGLKGRYTRSRSKLASYRHACDGIDVSSQDSAFFTMSGSACVNVRTCALRGDSQAFFSHLPDLEARGLGTLFRFMHNPELAEAAKKVMLLEMTADVEGTKMKVPEPA